MKRRPRMFVLLVTLALIAVAVGGASADKVTIYRDVWGVPHVYGDSEAAAAYGYGYAQAQDRLEQIFRNYRQAEGTLAEIDGPSALQSDSIARICRHAEFSREQYAAVPPQLRTYLEAYQAGVKRYMQEHPEQVPDWAPEFHPAQATSVMRSVIFNWPFDESIGDLQRAGVEPRFSSNQWTISPARSAYNCAMLFIDPHIDWAGMFRFHEAHIHGGNLHAFGWFVVGTPLVGLGHNDNIGWACTTGGPDTSDIYAETVDPNDPMRYRVNDGWATFDAKKIEIRVKEASGVSTVERDLLISRHGPIVAQEGGKAYAVATPYMNQTRMPLMLYRLMRASSTENVKRATAMNQWMEQNFMYAGTDGHIRYIRVGRVPIRPEGIDSSLPISGDTDANDWLGIHPQSDLVQIDDPPDGYMQNCNCTPTIMSRHQPVDPSKYPPYIFNADTGRPWHNRATRALNLLDADDHVTLTDALAIVNDTYVLGWENVQPQLAAAAKAVRSELVSAGAADIVDTLTAWDGRMEADSVGAALFFALWQALPEHMPGINRDALLRGDAQLTPAQYPQLVQAGGAAVDWLVQTHGTWQVKWGDINRVGRGDRSFPLAGCATGGITTLRAVGNGLDRNTGVLRCKDGQSCTTLVLFKPGDVESYSVTPWGESDDPNSPHYLDQAEKLFGQKKLKPTWFQLDDLLKGHVESTTVLEYGAPAG
jgi:acyl-homoserine-lactone acylase